MRTRTGARWPAAATSWAGLLVLSAAAFGAACSGGGGRPPVPAGSCAPAVNERLDPRSTIHLFPGAAEPRYLTDPPTSGPHQLGPPVVGVSATAIARPRQVAMLESGFVLLQHQPLPPAPSLMLAALAGPMVSVAPPAGPLKGAVVATSWTWKLECGSVTPASVSAIRAFIAAHRGVGFNDGR